MLSIFETSILLKEITERISFRMKFFKNFTQILEYKESFCMDRDYNIHSI